MEQSDNGVLNNKKFRGIIRLYIGPMFSGKTSSLIEAYTRHSIGKRKCLLIKFSGDNRYDENEVVAHNGKKISSTYVCNLLCEADNIVSEYDVICIDEVQFFEDAPIFCDKWANQGLIVEASGLSGTYLRTEFPVISKLIPIAEEVYKKSAVCVETGNDAQFTIRTSEEKDVVVVGGSDKYKPVDRHTFFEANNYIKYDEEMFSKFLDIYCNKNKLEIKDNKKEEIKHFKHNDKEGLGYVDIIKMFF